MLAIVTLSYSPIRLPKLESANLLKRLSRKQISPEHLRTLHAVGLFVSRFLSLIVVVELILSCGGCGALFIGGAIKTGSTFQGTVSVAQLNDINGNIQVTFVTFLQNGFSSSMTFCGNQISLFPPNQTVQINFNSGQPCATLLLVVVIG